MTRRPLRIFFLVATVALVLAAPASAATFKVTRTDDPAPDGCGVAGCTLREAIEAADLHHGADEVRLAAETYKLAEQPGAGADGGLTLRGPVTVVGAGRKKTKIDAQRQQRIFSVLSGRVTLRGIQIAEAQSTTGGAGITTSDVGKGVIELIDTQITDAFSDAGNGGGLYLAAGFEATLTRSRLDDAQAINGGGIYALGALKLVESRVDDMHAADGGGIYSTGRLELVDSRVDDSNATGDGGAIFSARLLRIRGGTVDDSQAIHGGGIAAAGRVTILNATVHDTHAAAGGGGLYTTAPGTKVSIRGSSFFTNHATEPGAPGGGVLAVAARMKLINDTFAYNTALGNGGAIAALAGSRVRLSNDTIAYNGAGEGENPGGENHPAGVGAVGGGLFAQSASLGFENSVIAVNAAHGAPNDCSGTTRSKGHNLSGRHCAGLGAKGDLRTKSPRLGQLDDFGGPVQTIRLRRGSPAIDAGGPHCPARDQRGFHRVGRCDIGAFEFGGFP